MQRIIISMGSAMALSALLLVGASYSPVYAKNGFGDQVTDETTAEDTTQGRSGKPAKDNGNEGTSTTETTTTTTTNGPKGQLKNDRYDCTPCTDTTVESDPVETDKPGKNR